MIDLSASRRTLTAMAAEYRSVDATELADGIDTLARLVALLAELGPDYALANVADEVSADFARLAYVLRVGRTVTEKRSKR